MRYYLTFEKLKNNEIAKKIIELFVKIIKKDFRIKASIFVIGIILWFNINLDKDFEINGKIPIKITNKQIGLTLKHSIPKFAKVKLRSQGKALFFLDLKTSLYFELDLDQVSTQKIFKLDPVSFINTTSKSVELLSVQYPKFIDIELDTLLTKKVPISVNQKFRTVPGYTKTGFFQQTPDSIIISGPASKIRTISKINTEFKPELTLDFDYNETLNLTLNDKETITYSANKVKLYQKIVRLGSNSIKLLIKKQNVPINEKFLIDPIYIDIVVSGSVTDLQKISEKDFYVYVNYNQINRSKMLAKIVVDTDVELDWKVSSNFVKVIE